MHNDDTPVGTIFTRRQALAATARLGLGLGFAGITRSLWADSAATQPAMPLIASPSLTEGPFFVDEKLNRSDLTTGTDRPSVVKGLPLMLGFTIYKMAGKILTPMKDAQVDVWHADAIGVYSDESNGMNHEDTAHQTWLRGFQMTGADGKVQFKTIMTGWYPGRTPHIHFKIRQPIASTSGSTTKPSTAEFTSQLFFREDDLDRVFTSEPYASRGKRRTRNADDGIYSEREADGTIAGQALTLDLKKMPAGDGLTATFPVILTDQSLSTRTGRGPGGRRGGPGGPPRDFDGPPPGGPRGPQRDDDPPPRL